MWDCISSSSSSHNAATSGSLARLPCVEWTGPIVLHAPPRHAHLLKGHVRSPATSPTGMYFSPPRTYPAPQGGVLEFFPYAAHAQFQPALIQSHMAQKPIMRGEMGARALRVRSVSREEAWASAGVQGAWVGVGVKPIRACCRIRGPPCCGAPPQGLCKAPHDSGICWKQFMMRL